MLKQTWSSYMPAKDSFRAVILFFSENDQLAHKW